jgi:pimeloyl-ACP methyl ester carboxylesterase
VWREIEPDSRHVAEVDGHNVVACSFGSVDELVSCLNGGPGNLKHWNRIPDLPRITVPVLITRGRHDELTPASAARMKRALPNARLHVPPNSSHMPFHVEPAAYYPVLRDFLASHQGRS